MLVGPCSPFRQFLGKRNLRCQKRPARTHKPTDCPSVRMALPTTEKISEPALFGLADELAVDAPSAVNPTRTTSTIANHISEVPIDAGFQPAANPLVVVFSGGTAFNNVAGQLQTLTTAVVHILPVSDDGGSTAEIVRVLGGPAVGDIRSRCLRLADDSNAEAQAVKQLLAHRLPSTDDLAAKLEWYSIVEGEHVLWQGVSEPYKHTIRAFLVQFHLQILGHTSKKFNYANGSVGNFFFAGARTFFRSLEAAIFLFSRVARIPEGSQVLPAIATEEHMTLGAELEDGTVIRGQNNISHPAAQGPRGNCVNKDNGQPPLPSPVRRIFYLSQEGTGQEHEVLPSANPRALQELDKCDAVMYSMGSLYTSICPTLCLAGTGEAIAKRQVPKIMLLNGSHDRETECSGAHDGPMRASDMVQAVCDALNRRRSRLGVRLRHGVSSYVNTLLVPEGGEIEVDRDALRLLGVQRVLQVPAFRDDNGLCVFRAEALVAMVAEITLASGAVSTASQMRNGQANCTIT